MVATRACVTILARMLPAWLRARPQNQPRMAATTAQRQFGKVPSHKWSRPKTAEQIKSAPSLLKVHSSTPLLQNAADEELFRQRHDREHADQGGGNLQQRSGSDEVGGAQQQRYRQPDGDEISEVQQADAPLPGVGEEAVAGFVHAPFLRQGHDGDGNQREVRNDLGVPEDFEGRIDRRVDGVEVSAEEDGGY